MRSIGYVPNISEGGLINASVRAETMFWNFNYFRLFVSQDVIKTLKLLRLRPMYYINEILFYRELLYTKTHSKERRLQIRQIQ